MGVTGPKIVILLSEHDRSEISVPLSRVPLSGASIDNDYLSVEGVSASPRRRDFLVRLPVTSYQFPGVYLGTLTFDVQFPSRT